MSENPYEPPKAPLDPNKNYLIYLKDRDNEIGINNDLFGVESVFINGVLFSKKWSFRKSQHVIRVRDDEYVVDFKLKATGKVGVYCSIIKNDKEIACFRVYPKISQIFWLPVFVTYLILFIVTGYIFSGSLEPTLPAGIMFIIIWLIIAAIINRMVMTVDKISDDFQEFT